MKVHTVVLVFIGIGVLLLGARLAVAIGLGDILVTDLNLAAVVRVNPLTGDRTILSDATHGTGTNFATPVDIVVESSVGVLVLDNDFSNTYSAVFRVNPVTGDRMIVSDSTNGSGLDFLNGNFLALESNGNILVTDNTLDSLLRADPVTGDRTVASTADQVGKCTITPGDPFECCTGLDTGDDTPPCVAVGSGLSLGGPRGITVESDGDILLMEATVKAVFRVDPSTGDRTIVSVADRVSFCSSAGVPWPCCMGGGTGNGTPPCVEVGSGPNFDEPFGLELEANGDILVEDVNLNAVFRVDSATGDRTILSDATHGTGTNFNAPRNAALEFDGDILVANAGRLLRIDPATGNRTIVSDAGTGSGPNLSTLLGVAVVPFWPVPALSLQGLVVFLLLAAGGALVFCRRRSRTMNG